MPTIGRVGVTHSLQQRTLSAAPPKSSGSAFHEAAGEQSPQTQRPHLRQWWRELSSQKSALQSSHLGASRSAVHLGAAPRNNAPKAPKASASADEREQSKRGRSAAFAVSAA